MTAAIIPLPGSHSASQPVAHYLRIGESGHRQLADLFAAGRFPAQRVVVDASRFEHQSELIKALQSAAVEVVLDTKAAELSALSKYSGYASNAPWALAGGSGPLTLESFKQIGSFDAIPALNRAQHFLDRDLALADRTARRIKELNPDEASLKPRPGESASAAKEKLIKRMESESHRIEKMRLALENLHEARGRAACRSLPVKPRQTIIEKRKSSGGW